MSYVSVYKRKVDLSDRDAFATRIFNLLCQNRNFVILDLINKHFISDGIGYGFTSINDFVGQIDGLEAFDVFKNYKQVGNHISNDVIFVNIEIYVNVIHFLIDTYGYGQLYAVLKAFSDYLLWHGHKIENLDDTTYVIVNSDLPITPEQIKSDEIKSDFLTYYGYLTSRDLHEKKKLLFAVAHELEAKKDDVLRILGKGIKNAIGFYSNQFHIRHPNHENIEGLTEDELETWYDYIYAFFINCYANLENLKEISIT